MAAVDPPMPGLGPELLALLLFLLVHVFGGRLRALAVHPRSRWLSFAGGISVAYVFIHIFPELREAQQSLGQAWQVVPFLEHHAYLVALAGLTLFYGLEVWVRRYQRQEDHPLHEEIFWLHIGSFALYNGLIGYLLVHREEADTRGLLLFTLAMGVHLLVNDNALRRHHEETYHRVGRWVLAAALVLGWLLGLAVEVSDAAVHALFAFLAGGVVLNVLKEELPEEQESRVWPFALGAGAYAALLLAF